MLHFFVCANSDPQSRTVTPAWLAYALVALVAWSRVHVGVHYPSDVAVGAAWGLATGEGYHRLLPTLFKLAPAHSGWLLTALCIPGLISSIAILVAYRRVRSGKNLPEWRLNACRGKYAKRRFA